LLRWTFRNCRECRKRVLPLSVSVAVAVAEPREGLADGPGGPGTTRVPGPLEAVPVLLAKEGSTDELRLVADAAGLMEEVPKPIVGVCEDDPVTVCLDGAAGAPQAETPRSRAIMTERMFMGRNSAARGSARWTLGRGPTPSSHTCLGSCRGRRNDPAWRTVRPPRPCHSQRWGQKNVPKGRSGGAGLLRYDWT